MPLGTIKTSDTPPSGFSIQNRMKSDYAEPKEAVQSDLIVSEPGDAKSFKDVWEQFVNFLRVEKKLNLLATLSSVSPHQEGNLIVVDIHNETQRELVEENRMFILNYVRKGMNQNQIDFKLNMLEESAVNFVKSSQDKYNEMLEKNPLLGILREKLDLGLE